MNFLPVFILFLKALAATLTDVPESFRRPDAIRENYENLSVIRQLVNYLTSKKTDASFI